MNEYTSIIFYYFELSGIFQEQGTHFIGRLEVMKLNHEIKINGLTFTFFREKSNHNQEELTLHMASFLGICCI